MRNLALESTSCVQIPCSSNSKISCVAHDLATSERYVAVENVLSGDEEVQVEVWKVAADGQVDDAPFALLMAPTSLTSKTQVVSLTLLAEQQVLCLLLSGGTIATCPLEPDFASLGASFEIVGEIDSGILAAAWSPEEDVLVLLSGAGELLQMTPTFDVLSESPLHTREGGEAQQVNVGWGSKQTQFHGSAGKQAAQAAPPQAVGLSEDDDGLPRVSWRGDGQFFAISSVDEGRRVIRVYSRAGVLQNTSEPVPGMEHTLAWKPSGALIAGTQRFGPKEGLGKGREGRHDVVFFERNGLRHGEFTLREEGRNGRGRYRVREMSWSAGSEVLALWIEREEGDVVQLWTVNNYHWYLKHDIHPPTQTERFTSLVWHPEHSLRLTLSTNTRIFDRIYAWTTTRSSELAPGDTGTVAVIDGSTLLVTPFRKMNVPPPMSGYQVDLGEDGEPPVDLAFDAEKDMLAVLKQRRVEVWELNTELGKGKVSEPKQVHALPLVEGIDARQVVLSDGKVAVLGYDWAHERDVVLEATPHNNAEWSRVERPSAGSGRLIAPASSGPLLFQGAKGRVTSVSDNIIDLKLPAFCFHTATLSSLPPSLGGLSAKGALHAVSPTISLTLATNCTSFICSSDFLIYTTSAHQAHFVPLSELLELLSSESDPVVPTWEQRRVERGSRIVTVIPSTMALVLQMPRGNLETVNPRPLVLRNVRRDIDTLGYRSAFLACRKHRIDLNILVDHNASQFMGSIAAFVEQVDDPDYINLFLSGIGQSSQTAEQKNEICDALRLQLEEKDLQRYVSSILTAHVVKTPPDVESALRLLLRLKEDNQEVVEEAIKYIVFLVDVNQLFNIALGMYDFSLVLMVAQHSQKDPREYLPFLRELSELEQNYQRFRIDDHLKRHDKALEYLRLAGDEHFPRARKYVETYPHLWSSALSLWRDDKGKEAELLELYGDHLMENKEYGDAAVAFVLSRKTEKALLAYEKDIAWRELFALATSAGASAERLSEIGARLSDKLSGKRRYAEGAQVLLDYSHNVDEAVGLLLMGNEWSEASRLSYLHGRPELVDEQVQPSALDAAGNMLDDLEEMSDQLLKQLSRWDELQQRKLADPSTFYHDEPDDPALHNVDVQSTASTVATNFTRYTVAPTVMTGVTGVSTSKSSKGRRKNERKRLSGKRGSVDEEVYLVSSLAKLVTRLNGLQTDVKGLLPHLVVFGEECREKAGELAQGMETFERKAGEALERVWTALEEGKKTRDEQREALVRAGGKWEEGEKVPEKPKVDAVKWRTAVLV